MRLARVLVLLTAVGTLAQAKLLVSDEIRGEPLLGAHLKPTDHMVPDEWEWQTGTPVRDQGACGACFAHATASQLEVWLGRSVAVNATEIARCVAPDCQGATLSQVYAYLQASGANTVEHTFDPWCYTMDKDVAVLEYAIGYFEDNDLERHLPAWLRDYGPVVVGVDAEDDTFQRYSGGLYEFPETAKTSVPNHAMLLVGYAPGYWKLRNSWGPYWGEEGTMRVRRKRNENAGIGRYVGIVTMTSET